MFKRLDPLRALGLAASASALALALAGPAIAQNEPAPSAAPASDEEVAPDIVVTAQFRSQRLQDTPLAITAVNAEMMEQRSQTNLSDVVKQAPSVQLLPATAAFGPSISASIRGLGQGDFNPAMEPGVGPYIDDVYYPRLTGANFDLLDVARVEVLRGPQGTLTGRNSEGGAIKFISRRPTGDGADSRRADRGTESIRVRPGGARERVRHAVLEQGAERRHPDRHPGKPEGVADPRRHPRSGGIHHAESAGRERGIRDPDSDAADNEAGEERRPARAGRTSGSRG